MTPKIDTIATAFTEFVRFCCNFGGVMVKYTLYSYKYLGRFYFQQEEPMTVRYDKLWILLIKNKMKKGELAKAAHLSSHPLS